jgi:endonuclease-3
MIKRDRANFIVCRLDELYPETPIPLEHSTLFELLVAVLLSAQCTDKRVNKVTPILFSEAKTAYEMQHMTLERVYEIIRPCGLAPKKSAAILKLSEILVNQYDGKVPENITKLEQLPGVGHKTASVVMSQGFGHPAFPVDTHIHRLAQRWGLTNGKNVIRTERDLKAIFHKDLWSKLHLQMIFYGREHCSAHGCDGRVCEICTTCYPNRKKPFKSKKP